MFTIYFRILNEYFLARLDQKQAAEGGKYKTQTLPLRLFLIVRFVLNGKVKEN